MASREVVVFVSIIGLIVSLLFLLATGSLSPLLLVVLFLILIVGSAFVPQLEEVKEYERGVVLRLGRFHRVQKPGWVLIFPSFEKMVTVDMRIRSVDTRSQEVETLDRIRLTVDAISYLRVTDPKKVAIDVRDLDGSIKQLMVAEIRNTVSKMEMDEVLGRTEEIGKTIESHFKDIEDKFGVAIIRTEIESVHPPATLLDAIRKKREATEMKTKMETEARARQVAIEILDSATSKMSERTLAYLYLDALKKIAEGRSNKILFPLELSRLASLLSAKMAGEGDEGRNAVDAAALRKLADEYLKNNEKDSNPKASRRKTKK